MVCNRHRHNRPMHISEKNICVVDLQRLMAIKRLLSQLKSITESYYLFVNEICLCPNKNCHCKICTSGGTNHFSILFRMINQYF